MSLPPIIANNPIVKLFRTEPQNAEKGGRAAPQKEAATPQDVVEISEAARQKLENAHVAAIDNEAQARAASEDARDALSADESQTLGLTPDFTV